MVISLEEFKQGTDKDSPIKSAKKIMELLINHKDKAYCIVDFQVILKMQYHFVNMGLRRIKATKEWMEQMQMKWYKEEGGRRIYYAYKQAEEKPKEEVRKC